MSDAVLVAEGLRVVVGEKTLLDDADLRVERGEIVLLAGPSGSGKSVLLRLVGGLLDARTPGFSFGGSLTVLGHDAVAVPGVTRGKVGLVFQDFALLEGLTAADNVRFAIDHRQPRLPPDEAETLRDDLLAHLGVEGHARVGTLSGGQRQRVAIARALAYAPEVLAYDEPTSGLDPAMRDRVALVIEKTSRERGATTIVVTHDLAGLTRIADRVVLLDPATGSLTEVAADEAESRLAALTPPAIREAGRPSLGARLTGRVTAFLETTSRAAEGTANALLHLVPRFKNLRWGLHFFLLYLKAVAGPGAMLYFLLAGAVIGMVSTYFTFNFLPFPDYTEPLILDDLIGGLGFALHRILVPLLMTVLLAARAGAAVSADISTRVAGRQTEAMRSLGAPPRRYLLTGVLWAFLIGTPVIAVLSFVGARIASAAVFSVMAPGVSLHAWDGMFHRLLTESGGLFPAGTGWVALKDLTAAFGIATIAYFAGARPKDSPEEVAQAITKTVIWATVLVLTVHVVFAFVEFD